MKHCTLCNRPVDPVKSKFSWAWFILLCFTGIGGIFYILYHIFMKTKSYCPVCNTKRLISERKFERKTNGTGAEKPSD